MNIAGPTILNLTYSGEIPVLREMYANLLASSMDTNIASMAHPAFVRIIEQLSPDEAKILGTLVDHPSGKALCHEITDDSGFRKRSDRYVYEQWDHICADAGVEHPENNGAYMDNLMRLRLIGHIYENKSAGGNSGQGDIGLGAAGCLPASVRWGWNREHGFTTWVTVNRCGITMSRVMLTSRRRQLGRKAGKSIPICRRSRVYRPSSGISRLMMSARRALAGKQPVAPGVGKRRSLDNP